MFRDQEFSQDMAGSASARAVKRIEDVRGAARTVQFPEDAGPMAHPVRPTATWKSTTSTPSPCMKRRGSGAHAAHPGGQRRLCPRA